MDRDLDHLVFLRLTEVTEFSKQTIISTWFLPSQVIYSYSFECDSVKGVVVANAFNVEI